MKGTDKMKIWRTFQTIDTHTGGEPTRTVVGGVPVIPGTTMEEKFIYMQTHNDWMRKVLSLEPLGNGVMSGHSGRRSKSYCGSRDTLCLVFGEALL